jgi:hypothetical protein
LYNKTAVVKFSYNKTAVMKFSLSSRKGSVNQLVDGVATDRECACDANPLLRRELLKTIDRAATVMQLLSLIQTLDLLRVGLDSIPPWFCPRRIAALFARSYPSGKIKITGSTVPSFFF